MTNRWPGTICGVVCGVLAVLIMLLIDFPREEGYHLYLALATPIAVGVTLDQTDYELPPRWVQGILVALFYTFGEYYALYDLYYWTPIILNAIGGAIIGLAVDHAGRITFRRREGRGDLEE